MQTDYISSSNRLADVTGDGLMPVSAVDNGCGELARDEKNAVPPSFEQWLNERTEGWNYGEIYHRAQRRIDRQLWEGCTWEEMQDCLFTSDDVLLLRAGGQATTRAEWEEVVEAMYRHQWQCYLAIWAAYQSAPCREQKALLYALLEAEESSASVLAE